MFVRRTIAAITLIAASVSAAAAQEPDPIAEASGRIGPFFVTPSFSVQELGIDTNVFNDASEKSDFTMTVVPRLDAAVPFGSRARLLTSTTAALVYYNQYSSERSINPDVRLRGEFGLNRVTVFVAPAYANSRMRPSLEIDTRARHQLANVSGGAQVMVSDRLSFEAGGSVSSVSFDEDAIYNDTSLRDTLNRRARVAWLTVSHEVTPLTSAVVRTEIKTERFPYSPARDADSLSVLPGVALKPFALISGGAAVGIRRFQPRSGLLPDYTGLVVHANLAYTLQGATRFRFTADRDLAYSYSGTQPYYVINGYGLAIERHLGGRFDVTGSGDWQTYTYRSFVGLDPEPGVEQVTRSRIWALSVGYRVARTRRVGFGVTYRERDSNGDSFVPFTGLRIIATLNSGL